MSKKRVTKIIAFLLLLSIMLTLFTYVLCVNEKRERVFIQGFYKEPENSIDVLLIGASELYTGFNSPLAYDEYGFTSYSLSVPGMTGYLYGSALDIGLKYQDPDLVVFEIGGFISNEKEFKKEGTIRKWTDNLPWGTDRLKAISELAPEGEEMAYYFPLLKYHNNWKERKLVTGILKNTIKSEKLEYHRTKCFSTRTDMDTMPGLYSESRHLTDDGRETLYALLDRCKEHGLENVMFVYAPHKTRLVHSDDVQEIGTIVESYGYDFKDYSHSYDEIGIDITHDFYNKEHLNIFGAQKYTSYLGGYITENYDINTEHSDEITAEWDHCAEYMKNACVTLEKKTEKREHKTYTEMSTFK